MDCVNETIQINSVIGCRSLVLMSNSEFKGEGGNLNSTAFHLYLNYLSH